MIAKSDPVAAEATGRSCASIPRGSLYGNPIGYSSWSAGRVGFELAHNDELVGEKSEFLSILDTCAAPRRRARTCQSALDPEGQVTATQALGGQKGSVVAIEPQTGEV